MEEKIESDNNIILPEDINPQDSEIQVSDIKETNIFRDLVSNLKNVGHEIINRHRQGKLPIQIFAFVVVYNFIFFQAEEGRELYVLLPLISAGLTFWLKYWENPKRISYYISSGSLFFGLFWDMFLSITFIPTYENWGYSLEAIPTIVADLLALMSAIVWFTNERESTKVNTMENMSNA